MMQIKRRVPILNLDRRAIPGKFKEIVEEATLVKRTKRGAYVQLVSNGDVIYRKEKDLLLEVAHV